MATIKKIQLPDGSVHDIGGGGGTVDQTFNPSSSNAQSGVAIGQTFAQPVKFFTTTITSGQTNKKLSDFGVGINLPPVGSLCLVRLTFTGYSGSTPRKFSAFTIVPVSLYSDTVADRLICSSSSNIPCFSDLGNSASTSTYYMSSVCVYLKDDKSLNLYLVSQIYDTGEVVVMPIGIDGYLQ